ncbi:DUF5053 domain-containing protein [Dysgonomonas sp. 520]|uniref:DUF5053 domain-containing protein n=1 Tax=Dysgonomonas sp. 520 TaxID=2302931 RepID=UPI0013D75160|nr:DUF5053 domain-containing protein [Dysgonomonas sp. 520]NDW11246.1 DUF5053 domain-containing protein [Dysgonomonas sp. 520]
MNEVEKYLAEWHTLKTDEDFANFDKKIKAEQAARTPQELEEISKQFEKGAEKAIKEAEELIEYLTVKQQLEDILPYISVSQIAQQYFKKSRHWFYQKLNGNIVNGKIASFNKDEVKVLSQALNDIGKKFQDTSIRLINT